MSIFDRIFHYRRYLLCLLVFFVSYFEILNSAPLYIPPNAINYLMQYNYLPHPHTQSGNRYRDSNMMLDQRLESFTDIDKTSVFQAIKLFQSFAGINITGFLDRDTIEAMSWRRCGVKDIPDDEEDLTNFNKDIRSTSYPKIHRRRSKRYVLQGSKWRKHTLSFRVDNYTSDMAKSVIDEQIKKALHVWMQHADINLYQTKGKADITISFEKGNHGDGEDFDGIGKVLAHAFFPQYGGDAHFDDDETWTTSPYRGSNLYQVAAHEFGHSLGLSHSNRRTALMAPFYKTFMGTIELDADDKIGIQKLYGPPKKLVKPPHKNRDITYRTTTPTSYAVNQDTDTIKPNNPFGFDFDIFKMFGHRRTYYPEEKKIFTTPEPIPSYDASEEKNICKIPRIDAITVNANKETIVFRGKYYWELNDQGVKSGFPHLIINDWPGITGDINAALSWGSKSNKTFLFKGKKYWRFSANKMLDIGYPKIINKGFPGLPDDLDAAFVWSGNGMTYFIKGNQYWRYAGTSFDRVDNGYPKQLFIWEGLPVKIDDAMRWKNGKTYFFSGHDYYRFNDEQFKIDKTFPRSAPLWWFGCFSDQHNYHTSHYDGLIAAPGDLNQLSSNIFHDYPNKNKGMKVRTGRNYRIVDPDTDSEGFYNSLNSYDNDQAIGNQVDKENSNESHSSNSHDTWVLVQKENNIDNFTNDIYKSLSQKKFKKKKPQKKNSKLSDVPETKDVRMPEKSKNYYNIKEIVNLKKSPNFVRSNADNKILIPKNILYSMFIVVLYLIRSPLYL
ncbi:unnamed protein product [Gordionus sp. m RMFG-2023]